jgi:hypothetical protein
MTELKQNAQEVKKLLPICMVAMAVKAIRRPGISAIKRCL